MKALCESLRNMTWQKDGVWVVSTYNTFHGSCSKAQYRKGGYRDLKMFILLDLSMFNLENNAPLLLVELQVHLYTFYRLKEPQMHLTYEFVRGSMDWKSDWYFDLLGIWNRFQQDPDALIRVQRSIHEISTQGRVNRQEFEAILREKWCWWDRSGRKLEASQLTEDHHVKISWFWELALASSDNEISGASDTHKQICPCPSVATWSIMLLEKPCSVTQPGGCQDAGSFDRVDYKQFCEEFFGADISNEIEEAPADPAPTPEAAPEEFNGFEHVSAFEAIC